MHARQTGIEGDRFLEFIYCLRQTAGHSKCPADHNMKLRPVAEVLKHPIKDLPCLSKLALLQVRYRQRETGIEVIRAKLERHFKFGGSLFVFAKGKIGLTQHAVSNGILRTERDSFV